MSGLFDLVDLRGIDVNMDDRRLGTEFFYPAVRPVVKAYSKGKQKIDLVEDVVGTWRAVQYRSMPR
jgi:hypothetical protein